MPKGVVGTVRERREKLEAELKALRAEEEKESVHRYALAGKVVLDQAAKDPAFAATLNALLEKALTKPKERKLFELPIGRSATDGPPDVRAD